MQADPEPGLAASVKNQEVDGWVNGPRVSVTTIQLRGSRARAAVGNSRQMTTGRGAHSVPWGALGSSGSAGGGEPWAPTLPGAPASRWGWHTAFPQGRGGMAGNGAAELCGQQLGTWRGAWSLFASCSGWARGAQPQLHLLGHAHWPSRIWGVECGGGVWGRASGYELLFYWSMGWSLGTGRCS